MYVTLAGSSQISVIDTVALQEHDVVPDDPDEMSSLGTQGIALPPGANPFDLTLDPDGKLLFVSDYTSANIYVIDVDPFSSRFHEVIQILSFETGGEQLAPLGLRGLAVSADGERLYVTAPKRDLFRSGAGGPGLILTADILTLDERRLSLIHI